MLNLSIFKLTKTINNRILFCLEVVVHVVSEIPEDSACITGCEYANKVVKLDLGCLGLTRLNNT